MSQTRIDFSELVRDYGDASKEVLSCRRAVALFDFSFISRVRVSGSNALAVLNRFQSRNLNDLPVNSICYSLRMNSSGSVISDLTLWRTDTCVYELMSGSPDDISDLSVLTGSDAEIEDLSAETSIFAVQGPDSLYALQDLVDINRLATLNYYQSDNFKILDIPCRIGRLGYTGERGFELIIPSKYAPTLWSQISRTARPAGFAAMDILRIEAGFILFCNECAYNFSAVELGLGAFTDTHLPVDYRLVCFTAQSDQLTTPWRPTGLVAKPQAGEILVTSACYSVLAKSVLGLGFVRDDHDRNCSLTDPSGQFYSIKLVDRPFYDSRKSKPRGAWIASGSRG